MTTTSHMLTIGQLARYSGVTVRAVRHYHRIGLLPEPERDRSGYRSYGADAIVRLIRIRTLASAGIPLVRVQELLDADEETFATDIAEIDRSLRAEIRRLQEHRRRIARLAAGDSLALPGSVVSYLDRIRDLGVGERYVALERDAWIMLAAQTPDQIDNWIATKNRELDDPDIQRLYRLVGNAIDWAADDPRVVEVVDILDTLFTRAMEQGNTDPDGLEDAFIEVLDSMTVNSAPAGARMIELLQERGWTGWTRIEQTTPSRRPIESEPRNTSSLSRAPGAEYNFE